MLPNNLTATALLTQPGGVQPKDNAKCGRYGARFHAQNQVSNALDGVREHTCEAVSTRRFVRQKRPRFSLLSTWRRRTGPDDRSRACKRVGRNARRNSTATRVQNFGKRDQARPELDVRIEVELRGGVRAPLPGHTNSLFFGEIQILNFMGGSICMGIATSRSRRPWGLNLHPPLARQGYRLRSDRYAAR